LQRRLGTADAVVIGLGSMMGAGVFVVFGPAAAAAGPALLVGLAVAAAVAYCNATSSARLAALYPMSGGTYIYGRERLGEFWGYLAGWNFVVGKTASCAAMALTVGLYLWPAHAHAVAVAAVATLTAVNLRGIEKSAVLTRVIVAIVAAVLAGVVLAVATSGDADPSRITVTGGHVGGVLQAAGLLFFAFAGYARVTTLGEEIRDPARTIPRAIRLALLLTLAVYVMVAVTLLAVLGTDLATSKAPLADAVHAAGADWLEPAVRAGAVVAALGSLLSLILGVSRTSLAMARDGHLPPALAAVHPRFAVPYRAELAVGVVVATVAATVDVPTAIGFSSFAVLLYYAIANASAWTLGGGLRSRLTPALGLVGCLLLACYLPSSSVLSGAAVAAVGAGIFAVRRLRWRHGFSR
jgi:APA family basic amino acid/polyamine antiporter